MNLTHAQRRVLVDLSDGDWMRLPDAIHPRSVVARVYSYGMIRCDDDSARYDDRLWTITPRGIEAMEIKHG